METLKCFKHINGPNLLEIFNRKLKIERFNARWKREKLRIFLNSDVNFVFLSGNFWDMRIFESGFLYILYESYKYLRAHMILFDNKTGNTIFLWIIFIHIEKNVCGNDMRLSNLIQHFSPIRHLIINLPAGLYVWELNLLRSYKYLYIFYSV